jgi:hypothetical protein
MFVIEPLNDTYIDLNISAETVIHAMNTITLDKHMNIISVNMNHQNMNVIEPIHTSTPVKHTLIATVTSNNNQATSHHI